MQSFDFKYSQSQDSAKQETKGDSHHDSDPNSFSNMFQKKLSDINPSLEIDPLDYFQGEFPSLGNSFPKTKIEYQESSQKTSSQKFDHPNLQNLQLPSSDQFKENFKFPQSNYLTQSPYLSYPYSTSSDMKLGKRGPYTKYGVELKQIAIQRVRAGQELRKVARDLKVPLKNLKRWVEVGAHRKKGGGRKTLDPDMEYELYQWCLSQLTDKPLTRGLIKQRARNLSRFQGSFKASKGWLDKFIKRYELGQVLRQSMDFDRKGKDCIPNYYFGGNQYYEDENEWKGENSEFDGSN